MSFGFSVSDLRVALQLALFLHEKCFTKAQGAGECGLSESPDICTADLLFLQMSFI